MYSPQQWPGGEGAVTRADRWKSLRGRAHEDENVDADGFVDEDEDEEQQRPSGNQQSANWYKRLDAQQKNVEAIGQPLGDFFWAKVYQSALKIYDIWAFHIK